MTPRLVIAVLLVGASNLYAAETEYTRTRNLPALKISFSDMQFALDKASNLIADANKEYKEQAKKARRPEELFFFQLSPRETLTLGTGPDEIKIEGHSFPANARLPKAAYALSYSYLLDNAPVSRFQIDLGDYVRRLSVSGTAVDQVEAISAALERDLSQHSATGGSEVRSSGFIIFIILVFAFLISGAYCITEKQWRYLGVPIFSLMGLVLLLTLPFKDLLAGFALYQGETSSTVRYEPQIALISLLLTIAGILLSIFIPIWQDRRTKQ